MLEEKKIQSAIIAYLKELYNKGYPVYVERRQAGGFSYKMGIPDLYAVINGHHLEIEVKRQGGCLRPMQEKYRDKCKMLNIAWICADKLDDIKAIVNELLTK